MENYSKLIPSGVKSYFANLLQVVYIKLTVEVIVQDRQVWTTKYPWMLKFYRIDPMCIKTEVEDDRTAKMVWSGRENLSN